MAYIKTLKNNELIGGTDNTDVYPVSSTQAIYSQTPDGTVPEGIKHQRLEERLEDHEEDAQELHRKVEKLVVTLGNNQENKTLEINGSSYTMNLVCGADIETYGDEDDEEVSPDNMTEKTITALYNSTTHTITGSKSGNKWVGTFTVAPGTPIIPVVGACTFTFTCSYQGIEKSDTSTTYFNLMKYFGFADSQPVTVEDLIALVNQEKAVAHFSNSVGCTVTIPANGTGFKYIYLAVPNGMTVNRVVQPDALNAPLDFPQVGTITRTIGGSDYTYKLYRSVDQIDSSVSKRLTIS